ncbi:MAG TPA: HAMP domain-containing histidine kinase [Arcobacter sp.]|nr:HAMP domain-containing histidine kinase [Arcobacter sp.]HIP55813.1 HAMP domain-containing histidine kinase [Arcobacter sp.]
MNNKYKNFLISNYIIVAFIILISLASNYILISLNSFSQDTFLPISIFTIIIALFLYKYLSSSIFDELFKSDKNIDTMLKKTLHELNTPVATIQMNLKMLNKNITNEKDIKRAQRIEDSCANLLKLYTNMEYEISSNVSSINLSTFDIKDIINNSISKVSDIKENITISNNTISSNILSDIIGFEIMLDNLLINAIKYNKKDGFINISNKNNTLYIEDSGCGIDIKNIFKVYDKYFQEDNLHHGFGLGLNIVKEYCDKYKIIIKIESKEDIGTTFSLDYSSIVSK